MTGDALFELPPGAPAAEPDAPAALTPGEKLRERQAEKLARGIHPLSMPRGKPIPLHPGAAPADNLAAAGLRCGSCRLRQLEGYRGKQFPKCVLPDARGRASRAAHCAASDVRAWWPACAGYEPKEDA